MQRQIENFRRYAVPHAPGDIIGPANEYTILHGGGGVFEENLERGFYNTPLGVNRQAVVYYNTLVPADVGYMAYSQVAGIDTTGVADYFSPLKIKSNLWPGINNNDTIYWKIYIGSIQIIGVPNTQNFALNYRTAAAVYWYWDFVNNVWVNVYNAATCTTFNNAGALGPKYDFFIERRNGFYRIFGRCLGLPNGYTIGNAIVRSPFVTDWVPEGNIGNGASADWITTGNSMGNRQSERAHIYHLSYDYWKWRNR